MRVLAVDDDALVLMNTAEMLIDLGHQVVSVSAAAEALTRLRDGGFDLLVTDQSMPGMTGLQLIDAMAAEGIDLPAILATGYSDQPHDPSRRLVTLGKPFREHDLAAAVLAAMQPQ